MADYWEMVIRMNDYQKKLPPNLEILISTEDLPPKILICPSAKDTPDQPAYIYRAADLAGKKFKEYYPQLILVHDRNGNHEDSRNVVFADGHVENLHDQHFLEAIEKDNALRRKLKLPEKPPR